jgi:hypothetical protein
MFSTHGTDLISDVWASIIGSNNRSRARKSLQQVQAFEMAQQSRRSIHFPASLRTTNIYFAHGAVALFIQIT